MKLRLTKFRAPNQQVLIIPYNDMDLQGRQTGPGGQSLRFSKVGDTSKELDDRVAYGILSTHGDMLELAGGQHKRATPPVTK